MAQSRSVDRAQKRVVHCEASLTGFGAAVAVEAADLKEIWGEISLEFKTLGQTEDKSYDRTRGDNKKTTDFVRLSQGVTFTIRQPFPI